jgi:RNA polymerase sigma-70 factor (ECF subfamily)
MGEGGSGNGSEAGTGTGAMSALVERLKPIAAVGESGSGNVSTERAGTAEADFAARMQQAKQVVFRVAYSVLHEAADAEEIAQDAFIRAYGQMGSLREPEKFRAWVCRIAFRLALNRRRSQGRRMARDTAWHESQARQVADGERAGEEREYLARLRNEIERLPEKLRSVVLLASVAGMEAGEVAAMLEIPSGTVRRRLHEARKKLIEVMKRR